MSHDSVDPDKTVTFKNHLGDRYIWPFELCRSFDAIKPLLEEVYTLLSEKKLVDQIKQGQYEIQTDDGETILPSVWSAIVKPLSTIRVSFLLYDDKRGQESIQGSESGFNNVERFRDDDDVDEPEPVQTDSENSLSDSESEDDLVTQSSVENEDRSPEKPDLPESFREVAPAVDNDGNKLSFTVDTFHQKRPENPKKDPESVGDDPTALETQKGTNLETLKITKATSAALDNRNLIQVHVLPGPENPQLRKSVKVTWYHIHAGRLDYGRFRNLCLTVPDLPENVRILIRAALRKVEKEKVKAFLDGRFIEPGTVIRVDERGQPEAPSVIFSCIPYLDLQSAARRLSDGLDDRLFPPRTLMQSYYPYEPVRERDEEQAYRKFGNDHSSSVIYVPNLWMMNIGSNVVVTYGHEALSQELIKSIEVIQENLELLGTTDFTKDSLTNIRLTDWDGRVLLFPLNACRSFFQMEQKIRELKYSTLGDASRSLQLAHITAQGEETVEARAWCEIIKRTDVIFIEMALNGGNHAKKIQATSDEMSFLESTTLQSPSLVPPFFHWPSTPIDDVIKEKEKGGGPAPTALKRSMYCLEHVEKGMVSETLDNYDTVNAVDKTFTSNTFYHSLPEDTNAHIRSQFLSLQHSPIQKQGQDLTYSHHQTVIDSQCVEILERSAKFFKTVHRTLELFVADVNKSTILRKVWGAMAGIRDIAATIEKRGVLECDPHECSDTHWKHPLMAERGWFIRSNFNDIFVPAPDADEKFKRAVRRCKRCRSFEPFKSPEAAREHLEKHLKPKAQPDSLQTTEASSSLPPSGPPSKPLTPDPDLRDWVINYAQLKQEVSNAGTLSILTQACDTAIDLCLKAEELADGVRNEDGKMSELYTLPRQLVEAFREIIVFYLAVERALHHTEESYRKDNILKDDFDIYSLPYSEKGLEVLKRFGEGPRRSLIIARSQLCSMVATKEPWDTFRNLSLGSEYICAWLMRRLLVKPLNKQMTVADMYREYMSTIQFQVNHRPGKRLLRSIKLVQEELHVLSEVNNWQTKLIQNYSRVLDDKSYEKDNPSRRTMFPYERMLLRSCLENLSLVQEEFTELIRRCGPLSDSTKQSLEINEEDHGKAIMVFTVVTVIFLPLSFVTSYLGMNTADIRDMDNLQSLFWAIALPLTLVTMGTCLFIGYNGDEIRDTASALYRAVTGKQDRSTSARGISVAQRKSARKLQSDSNSTVESSNLGDEAEYASPRPEYWGDEYGRKFVTSSYNKQYPIDMEPANLKISMPSSRSRLQTKTFVEPISSIPMVSERPTYFRVNRRHVDIDTLLYFAMPYEIDPDDPDFFLIKQDISDQEAQMLFEHTKRLRVRRDERERTRYGRDDAGYREAERVEYTVSRPRVRVSEMFEDDGGDTGQVHEYTWHKKRSGRGPGRRSGGVSRRRTWGEGRERVVRY